MTVTYHAGRRIQGLDSDRTGTQLPLGSVGGWVELGRTTLGSAGDNIDVTGLSDKRYYMVLADAQLDGAAMDMQFRLNGDTGSNYSSRYSSNGGSDGTTTSGSSLVVNSPDDSSDKFIVGYLANRSANEKLGIWHSADTNAAGATNAPNRREAVNKHAQTSNPISSILGFNAQSGSYATGSECVVLGWDPADTHTNNFWEELDEVTASGSPSTLDTNTFTAKKYLWIQMFTDNNGAGYADWRIRFNSDTGSNYSMRQSSNGGTDGTFTSLGYFGSYIQSTGNTFWNAFIINNQSNEKLVLGHTMGNDTAGATDAGNRIEFAAKWANTSSQITQMNIYRDSGTGTFGDNTIIKVWGAD